MTLTELRQYWGTGCLLLAFGVSLTFNVLLAQRVRSLEDFIRPRNGGIQVGAVIPPLPAESLDGVKALATFTSEPTILYVLSPTCSWCDKNYDNIRALAEGSKLGYRFVGISLNVAGGVGELKAHLAAHPLPFDVVHLTKDADTIAEASDLIATPQLAVLEGGKVTHAWVGALSDTSQRQVEEFFGTKLPGLRGVGADASSR